jgi:hypothetical protein
MTLIKILTYIIFGIALLIVLAVVAKAIYSAIEMIMIRNYIWEVMAYESLII